MTTNPAGGDLDALRDGIRRLLFQACTDPTPPAWLQQAADSITDVVARFGDHTAEHNAGNAITIRDLAEQQALLRRAIRRWLIRGVNDGRLTREQADDALTSFAMPPLPHGYQVSATIHLHTATPVAEHPDDEHNHTAAVVGATRDALTQALTSRRSTISDIDLRPEPGPDGGAVAPASSDGSAGQRVHLGGTASVTVTVAAKDRDDAVPAAMTRLLLRLVPAVGEITTDVGLIVIDAVRPTPLPLDPDHD